MLISTGGTVIKMPVDEIKRAGRADPGRDRDATARGRDRSRRLRPSSSPITATARSSQEAWIRARAEVTGPIEEERVRPWATVLRVPTSGGTLYFKESEPPHVHEYRLIEILAQRRPELVTEVLFSDQDGRMLMRNGGDQLSTVLDRNLDTRTGRKRCPATRTADLSCEGC